jgi:hypothetical protein
MGDTGKLNPEQIARQTRDAALHTAEDDYRSDLGAAAAKRANAIREANATKAEAVEQAHAALDIPRRRLSEAKDRIEAQLRKQDLEQTRREQENILIKAEATRLKSLKQADELGKHLTAEAAQARRLAIQAAYDNEKKAIQEARLALKTKKESTRVNLENKRKSKQLEKQEDHKVSDIPKVDIKTLETGATQVPVMTPPEDTANLPLSQKGMIKITIAHGNVDSDYLVDFENNLRNISEIRIIMVGGSNREGAQVIVATEQVVALAELIRQFPIVEKVEDRQGDILVKLKPMLVLEEKA